MDRTDGELWAEIVAVEQRQRRLWAEFNRASSRTEILSEALRGGAWEARAALSFLGALSGDVPRLVDQLFGMALSHGWASEARQVIERGLPEQKHPRVRELAWQHLTEPDAEARDYFIIAELMRHIGDREGLAEVVRRAGASTDPEIREVAGWQAGPG